MALQEQVQHVGYTHLNIIADISGSSASTFTVTLPQQVNKVVEIYVVDWQVTGVPVTSGVPDDVFYAWKITTLPGSGGVLSTDAGLSGYVLLPLDGAVSRAHSDAAPQRIYAGQPIDISSFTHELVNGTAKSNVTSRDTLVITLLLKQKL